ncbi:MAG: EI24 domain-containing protein [Myxococcales bacterium]|nr:EI24 domain-containing protein [Myxococcales bacterium]
MTGFARGARDVSDGFRFLRAHPGLWIWAIAPALVALIVLAGAVVAVAAIAGPLVDWVAGWMPSAIERWASGLVWALTVIALGVVALVLFVPVVGVVAGPFNELLAAAVDARHTGRVRPPAGALAFLRDALVGAVVGLGRVLATAVIAVLLFALSLVPVIGGIAAGAIAVWLTMRGAAVDCYEAAFASRGLGRRAVRAHLAQDRRRGLGLGAAVAALLLVPRVNLITLGLGTVGATLATADLEGPRPPGQ